jgi:succinate dehydrogenase/fumarate reductase flavoprotein subunit
VVGGGGAGLAAAIEAREAGANTILIEKNPALGGSTAWSIGSFTATQTPHQLAKGIQDSPDEHFEDMPKFSGKQADCDNPALRRLFVDNANETLRWLIGHGIEFFGPMPEPPHTKPRMHNVLPNSRAYITRLEAYARRIGVDVRPATPATKFLTEGGRVTGVECGGKGAISARVVVLASGDYSASPALKEKYISHDVSLVDAMNPTATGDGHEMAFPLGAKVINGDVLSGPNLRFVPPPKETLQRMLPASPFIAKCMKWALEYAPQALLRPFVLKFTVTSMAPELNMFAKGALLVNKLGARITGAPPSLGLNIAQHPDKIGYVLLDADLAERFNAWPDFVSTAPGVSYAYFDDFRRTRPDIFFKADSVEELARKLGMDAAALKSSVEAHNAEAPAKFEKAPYYALGPAKSYIVLTDGGLAVNEQLQILGENDQPIPGLYGAGSAGQGGLMLKGHGHHIGWAFTSGRIAGKLAAAEALQKNAA